MVSVRRQSMDFGGINSSGTRAQRQHEALPILFLTAVIEIPCACHPR